MPFWDAHSAIGSVAQEIVPQLDPGTIVIILDAAAPYAGALPQRDDITYIIGHPCHPPLYAHDIDDPDQRASFDPSTRALIEKAGL